MIESYLLPTHDMLEWGSGYSTLWFSQFVNKYYSIEHHEEWYSTVQSKLRDTKNVQHKLSHVPDGHKGWGGGFEEGTLEQFKEYVESASNFGLAKFDRVLIDGRSRAACAEYIVPFLTADSVVFMHDYHDRPYYHNVVNKLYQQIGCIDVGQSLVVLRLKAASV